MPPPPLPGGQRLLQAGFAYPERAEPASLPGAKACFAEIAKASSARGRAAPLRLLLLALALEHLPKRRRRRQEQLADGEHHRPAERIEQVGLIVRRHQAERIMH